MDTTTQTYMVPECNLAELESRLGKLSRRCKKLGMSEIAVSKQPDHTRHQVKQTTVDCTTNLVWRKSIDKNPNPKGFLENAFEPTGEVMIWWSVTVTGQKPTYEGWQFVAVLEPMTTDDGQTLNLVRGMPGETCPVAYRDIVGRCDHCQTARRRKETFVVRDEAGNHKCVGRQCLKDFLGYNEDPHTLASQLEALAQLGDICGQAEDCDGEYGITQAASRAESQRKQA